MSDHDLMQTEGEEASPVYERLRADIIAGAYPPGSALRFADMQKRYDLGVSRLREALAQLTADRLVVREINRGFRVPEVSLADFDDIAAMRLRLEPGAFRVSVENGDEEWEERILIAAHRLDRASRRYEAGTVNAVHDEWEARHRAFHEALIDACGSAMTRHFCGVLYDHFDRYRRLIGFDPDAQQRLASQHKALADCAVNRDVARAEAMLTEHVERTARVVRAALAEKLG
ncbi:FCD domain-containing protein [Roseibacterium sp. SDUM158016]|uniref:GntR family transcriptional regulator n=1 Tax=Roseicyclus sediminis TaxID=2980997 RepID=UPI0021D0A5FA|nr:FCD domain-containing protein [Roseibacterium sp. SDUM158016]MCU4651805.1 FCD domain-containing protein [Roseibacterium sp. SDUM158016]